MRIDCPWCGPRPLDEYTYGGDANSKRPDETADLSAWMDHVYLRANPAGLHKEYWHHASGCRSWLVVTRNTNTHVIETVALSADPLERHKK